MADIIIDGVHIKEANTLQDVFSNINPINVKTIDCNPSPHGKSFDIGLLARCVNLKKAKLLGNIIDQRPNILLPPYTLAPLGACGNLNKLTIEHNCGDSRTPMRITGLGFLRNTSLNSITVLGSACEHVGRQWFRHYAQETPICDGAFIAC